MRSWHLRRLGLPSRPEGGMTYANWRFGVDRIAEVRCSFHLDNDPGPSSDLYLQLYDAPIDGTGTYHGVQTTNLVIFSRFGTVDVEEVRPAPGAYAVAGTDEGPFVSLRMAYPIGPGSFTSVLRRMAGDGDGDWFELAVGRAGEPETVLGAVRFPRRRTPAPASIADGGGSWTEFWDNNGAVFHPVPHWKVRLDPPVANGTVPAEGVTLRYSRMPCSLIEWDAARGQVVTVVGGDARHTAGGSRTLRLR